MVYGDFLSDFRTSYAVIKALENMEEAAKKFPESLRVKYPTIPFKDMAGLRDVVTRNYDGSSDDTAIITKDIPEFLPNFGDHDGCVGETELTDKERQPGRNGLIYHKNASKSIE